MKVELIAAFLGFLSSCALDASWAGCLCQQDSFASSALEYIQLLNS